MLRTSTLLRVFGQVCAVSMSKSERTITRRERLEAKRFGQGHNGSIATLDGSAVVLISSFAGSMINAMQLAGNVVCVCHGECVRVDTIWSVYAPKITAQFLNTQTKLVTSN